MGNGLDRTFEQNDIQDVGHIDFTDIIDQFIDEFLFFIAVFDKWPFLGLNMFLNNCDTNHKGGVVWDKSLFRMNRVVVKFFWSISEEY